MALAYLVDPENQFMTKAGTINVEGYLRVYDAATDDQAITYCNFVGTENPEKIVLDNNGRAVVIADSDRAYRLEVYNRYGTLLWTTSPLWCLAAGGGVQGSDIISTDGSISVDKTTVGSMTTFDIGLAPQSDEFLEWCKCSEDNLNNGTWYPTVNEGTMVSEVLQGLHVNAGQLYHITTTIKVDPTGTGITYDTLSANLMFNDGEEHQITRRNYDVDSSVNDPVLCEFSYDFIPDNDGYIYLGVAGVAYFEHVSVEMQVHRIYSGINAVPDTCATRQWVKDTFDADMAEKISYSALEYNGNGAISGISGSSIAGGLDSATVSAIASSYAESAASGKLDNSASSTWYPMDGNPSGFLTWVDLSPYATTEYVDSSVSSKVDQSAFDDCCSAMSGYVSSLQDSATALQNDVSSISASVSAVTGNTGNYIDWSASGTFQESGNYVSSSDMSAYVPFASMAGEDNVITSISGSAIGNTSIGHEYNGVWPVVVDNTADTIAVLNKSLCVDETMTGYESAGSAVIGVNTATVLSGLTAYQQIADMTGYQPVGDYAFNSSVSGKLDASASSDFYSTSNPSGFLVADDITAKADASSLADYQPTSAMTAYQSAGNYLGPDDITGKADSSALTAYQTIDGMTAYQTVDGMTGYQSAGDYAFNSALSSKLDASASSQFVTSLAGYATTEYVDSSVSSKQDISAMTAYQSAGDYAFNSSLSSKLDQSAIELTGEWVSGIALSGSSYKLYAGWASEASMAQTAYYDSEGNDLNAYVHALSANSGDWNSVSAKQDASAMSAYQEVSGMTAYQSAGNYQPSGDYIYESALGWAEV